MISNPKSRTRPVERGLWWLAATLIALLLSGLQLTITAPYRLTSFERMASFTAVEPFQHRVLVPAIAAAIQRIAPLGDRLVFGTLEVLSWLALIALAYRALDVFRITTSETLRRALALSLVIPLAIVVLMPDLWLTPTFAPGAGPLELGDWGARTLFYYPYDLPAATFTLAMLLGLTHWAQHPTAARFLGLGLLFAIATINRETTLFFIPMAALMLAPSVPVARLGLALGALLALYVAVQWPLHWLFADHVNPHAGLGSTDYEIHFDENLRLLSQPFYLLTVPVRFMGGCWLVALLWWGYIERRLQAAVLGLVVPLVLAGLVIGRIAEHRIFIEAVPLLWLAGLQAMHGRIDAERQP